MYELNQIDVLLLRPKISIAISTHTNQNWHLFCRFLHPSNKWKTGNQQHQRFTQNDRSPMKCGLCDFGACNYINNALEIQTKESTVPKSCVRCVPKNRMKTFSTNFELNMSSSCTLFGVCSTVQTKHNIEHEQFCSLHGMASPQTLFIVVFIFKSKYTLCKHFRFRWNKTVFMARAQ